jgi:hypothetical protein
LVGCCLIGLLAPSARAQSTGVYTYPGVTAPVARSTPAVTPAVYWSAPAPSAGQPRAALPPVQVFPPLQPAPQARAGFPIQPVAYQPKGPDRPGIGADDTTVISPIQLEPPGLERVARLDTEDTLQQRIRQDTQGVLPNERVIFPDEPILSRDTYNGRGPIWAPRTMIAEPAYDVYERLYFEQPNFERYGWDLGILSPVISVAAFYGDVALLPYNFAKCPCWKYDSSVGYCLPGDPVPLLLYPPEISLTGAVAEVGVIFALMAIFP